MGFMSAIKITKTKKKQARVTDDGHFLFLAYFKRDLKKTLGVCLNRNALNVKVLLKFYQLA